MVENLIKLTALGFGLVVVISMLQGGVASDMLTDSSGGGGTPDIGVNKNVSQMDNVSNATLSVDEDTMESAKVVDAYGTVKNDKASRVILYLKGVNGTEGNLQNSTLTVESEGDSQTLDISYKSTSSEFTLFSQDGEGGTYNITGGDDNVYLQADLQQTTVGGIREGDVLTLTLETQTGESISVDVRFTSDLTDKEVFTTGHD